MSRSADDIKQNAISTYLGMPLKVNFGTLANNYQDADEVGVLVNRA
ncbi:MAG: hypothetical protein J6R83_02745 [Clostridia bacterium]|nr:hypothetical protein [Clostridia bacterium]